MQCPECRYISFKIEKACGACGFKFKKTQQGSSLTGKDSFSLFAGPAVKKQEENENIIESVGVLEEQEPASFIDTESGEFKLDLPEIQEDEIEKAQVSSDLEISEYEPLEFDPDADIDLGEVEIEGLGLEPFQTKKEAKSDEAEMLEVSPEITTVDSEEKSLDLGEIPSLEPALEIAEPEEEPTLSIDEPALETPEPEVEMETPKLDLGDSEIKLDLGYEPPPTNEPDPATLAAQLDSLDLNLEIDDSEGPLNIQSNETPDIEIEDLGLELEDDSDENKS